jgi:PAS domain S-box-containing protein
LDGSRGTGLRRRTAGIESLLPAILDCVAQPVWVVDPAGDLLFANPAALTALGYESLEELEGKPSHETIHYERPDGSPFPVEECPMLRPRTTGETINVDEDWFFRRDGSMFPVSYSSAPIDLAEGRGAVVAFINIEERRREEQALRERDVILDSLAQPVFMTSEGLIRYVNPAAVEVLGFDSPAEIQGQVGHWLVHYKRRDGSPYPIEECPLWLAGKDHKPLQVDEDWWFRKDGSMMPVSYSAVPLEGVRGAAMVVAFNDISERLAREEAERDREIAEARSAELAASEARQRATLEAALDCVISIDERGFLTYFNAAAERTFGYRADDVIGQELAELIIPPALRKDHRRGLARYLATGEGAVLDRRIELTGMRADGSEFPVELTVTRVDLVGAPGFTAYLRDITERKRAEQQLIDARRRVIEAADAERRRLTRDLHDSVQQELVNVVVNLQLAKQSGGGSEEAEETVDVAFAAANRGLEGLRELAAGVHPTILTTRGLGAAVESLAGRLPLPVDLVELSDVRLPTEAEASLYFFISEALTNVVKHAEASRAIVRITAGDPLQVEVSDDGIGGAGVETAGSGLAGLADRIAALDGELTIDSPPGGGTRLYAQVPLPAAGASRE